MDEWITSENANVVEAWATSIGVAVALLGAIAAVSQLVMIRRDSRDRTRPYVQIDVVPGLQGLGSWDLIIENRGASTALRVVVNAGDFEPLDAEDHIAPYIGAYLTTPKTLVPGARRRVMWGYERADVDSRAGVLEPREVAVTYLDERKARWWWRRCRPYKATFNVGDALGPTVFPAPFEGSTSPSGDALANINHAIRELNTHVGELRR